MDKELMLNCLTTMDRVNEVIDTTNQMSNEEERIKVLCDYFYRGRDFSPPSDPLSPEYRDFILAFYSEITGRTYDPAVCELSPFLAESKHLFRLAPYEYQSSEMLG